jgi:hypothetical protein
VSTLESWFVIVLLVFIVGVAVRHLSTGPEPPQPRARVRTAFDVERTTWLMDWEPRREPVIDGPLETWLEGENHVP